MEFSSEAYKCKSCYRCLEPWYFTESQKNKYKMDNSKFVECIQCQTGVFAAYDICCHFINLCLVLAFIGVIMYSTMYFGMKYCSTHKEICLHPFESIVQGIQNAVIATFASIKQGLSAI